MIELPFYTSLAFDFMSIIHQRLRRSTRHRYYVFEMIRCADGAIGCRGYDGQDRSTKLRRYFADKIREWYFDLNMMALKPSERGRYCCEKEFRGVKITASEIMLIYDKLIGVDQKKLSDVYGEDLVSKVVGTPLDMITTSSRELLMKECERLAKEMYDKESELRNAKNVKITAINDEYKIQLEAMKSEYAAKIDDIKKRLAENTENK
jgi:hypothetical protein